MDMFSKRITKRILVFVLVSAVLLSDSGMAALAAEISNTPETSISENSVEQTPDIPDESPVLDENSDSETLDHTEAELIGEIAEKPDLPALHMGYVKHGEDLPASDDSLFLYDLPISFETSDRILLFADYSISEDAETENGSFVWSILRGEKGLTPGTTCLLRKDDDWTDYETVSDSPYFTMTQIKDADSEYDQMAELVQKDMTSGEDSGNVEGDIAPDNYDYYIRAAYYTGSETEQDEAFYAAVTVPFLPWEDTPADQNPEDTAEEEIPTDAISDETAVSENDIDVIDDEMPMDSPDDTHAADEGVVEDVSEDADQTPEISQTISENNIESENSSTLDASGLDGQELPESEEQESQGLEKEPDGKITLYQGTEATPENIVNSRITLAPKDTQQITAKLDPEPPQTDSTILWESSDENVAIVTADADGAATITAIAEGYAGITASWHGITASVVVDVVRDKENPDNDKLLDLSGDIRVAGFEKESDAFVYNGQKITQNFRVYHKNTLLTEKTDYTLIYKNNINAAEWNSLKAPSVTINLKGQYQGSVTLYYTIKPLDINDIDIYNPNTSDQNGNTVKKSPGYEQTVNYSKNLNIPAPVLTYGKKKLAVKKDFVCDYTVPGDGMTAMPADYKNGDLYDAGKVYSYTVRGTGNFTGSFPMQLVILTDKKMNFSTASVKLDKKQYEYAGTPLTASDVRIDAVKIGGQVLDPSLYQYEVFATGLQGAYVLLSPSDAGRTAGYRGCKNITLKLVGDRQIKAAVRGADWQEEILFSQKTVDKEGGIFQKGTSLLTFAEASGEMIPLVEGTDYSIKYSNAKKAGKVTVTFTGMGRYKGSLKLPYTITPNTGIRIFSGSNVKHNNGTYEVAYQKGGAIPELVLKDQDDTILKMKTDYTIKYKDNKAAGSTMTCVITGKGNYKGYENTLSLLVTRADISNENNARSCITLSAPDKPYDARPNKWKSTITVTDTNGKKLAAGTDYEKEIVYTYENSNPSDQGAVPAIGTFITVKITGINNYEGTFTQENAYRIYDKAKGIDKLKVVIDPQEYTGAEITLLPVRDIHIYANNTDAKKKQNEITKSCYEITGYTNNIKAGTAKVTLHGIGEYGGTKTYSFKIQKKKYRINRVKGITMNKTSLSLPLAQADPDKLTLSATITSETSEEIANPTIVWSSSNSSIVAIKENPDVIKGFSDGKATVTTSVVLTLIKDGSVTITATSQDGNRKAQCKVSVIDAPMLQEAGETVRADIGNTYELHMEFAPSQDLAKVKWESSNAAVVSVEKTNTGATLTMKKAGAAVIKAVYISAGNRSYTQECYALSIDPQEEAPEGKILTYHQEPGCTDDTPYINKLLRDWEWGDRSKYEAMYLPAGVYHIDATGGGKDALGKDKFGGIILTDDQQLIMSSSTLLVALGNNREDTRVIWAFGRKNVKISGGQIIGERKIHKGSGGEHGHGIQISGCTNVTIENVDISQCWGDGIYLGFYDGPNLASNGVTIKNCSLHHNRRNNLSVTDASNVTIENCEFNYASGTAPQYGIDIEPNKNRTCSNVTISNSTFKGNAGGTIQILGQLNAHVKGVRIENCTGDKKPVTWQGFDGSVSGVTEKNNKWG